MYNAKRYKHSQHMTDNTMMSNKKQKKNTKTTTTTAPGGCHDMSHSFRPGQVT